MTVSKISKKEESFIDGKKTSKNKSDVQAIVLRVPVNLLKKIDAKIEKREIKTSRNTWLLEAIHKSI